MYTGTRQVKSVRGRGWVGMQGHGQDQLLKMGQLLLSPGQAQTSCYGIFTFFQEKSEIKDFMGNVLVVQLSINSM